MKQIEMNLGKKKPVSGGIDKMEFAIAIDASGQGTYNLLGTYEEIEFYCDSNNLWVDRYLDYVAPSTVRQGFNYVGSGKNPYELQRGFNYNTHEPIVDNSF